MSERIWGPDNPYVCPVCKKANPRCECGKWALAASKEGQTDA